MSRRPAAGIVLLAGCLSSFPAWSAEESAEAWLMRINRAARELNYDGTFVYHQGRQLEAMRIIHRVKNGIAQERLISLNGSAREIIRNDRIVWCYLPDEKRVIVERRPAKTRGFPTLLPESLSALGRNYALQLGGAGRIAGRNAREVVIRPRDAYRYGYRLWADADSALLLRAELVDLDSNLLEQFLFTQVTIGRPIGDEELKPGVRGGEMQWVDPPMGHANAEAARERPRWTASRLPRGFRLVSRLARGLPSRENLAEHLVYSDGLAAVSVFVERIRNGKAGMMEGGSRMGAVHAYGRRLDGHHVTVVGEVPAATVSLIAGSLEPGD